MCMCVYLYMHIIYRKKTIIRKGEVICREAKPRHRETAQQKTWLLQQDNKVKEEWRKGGSKGKRW